MIAKVSLVKPTAQISEQIVLPSREEPPPLVWEMGIETAGDLLEGFSSTNM
jgi:hypothetical protein